MPTSVQVHPSKLTRGDVIVHSDVPGFIKDPVAVLYAYTSPGGGAGMGEYPPSWSVVLSDGRVITGNDWSQHATEFPRTYTISGKAVFARDGKLVLFSGS